MKVSGYFLACTLMLLITIVCVGKVTDYNIPTYFEKQLKEKIDVIRINSREGASFIFITDTHVISNKMQSPYLIRRILNNTSIKTVIWGGDAINSHSNDIDMQWKKQLVFDSVFNGACQLYKVRGNHDFSVLGNDNTDGFSFSNKKSAEYLLKNIPSNVHRNFNDSEACYYYFDDEARRVRYIIFDSSDSVSNVANIHGNVTNMRDIQLQWIADSAIATTANGYGIIFISHIPITNWGYGKKAPLTKARKIIESIESHSKGMIGDVEYDFSKLGNVKVLMCIAGHIHEDSQTYINGIPYVTIANDGKIKKLKSRKIEGKKQRRLGTLDEQCFDCFIINKEKSRIQTYRIGYGVDRLFNLKQIKIPIKKRKKLSSNLTGKKRWSSYNAIVNKYKNGRIVYNDIVNVDDNGYVVGLKKGEAVIVATDFKGNKEFYDISVN